MYIDSHCHLELLEDISSVIKRAIKNNVRIIVYNSINLETMKYALELEKKYKEIKVALGVYPIDGLNLSEKEFDKSLDFIRQNKNKLIAIGEIGIDLKESKEFDKQKNNFLKFIRLSKELNVPIIVHSRYAEEEVIDILQKEKAEKVVMHCFNGGMNLVLRIINNGWYFSIPTNITFLNHFQELVKLCPITQLLCETDSPFLHPIKGERNNEPANIIESYKKLAEIKKISLNECEKIIENNFKRLFS